MKPFILYNQSGSLEPNALDGLLLWIDVSEQGTLSRTGNKANHVYDKSPHNNMFISTGLHKPIILQSKFEGRSALKFYNDTKMTGTHELSSDQIGTIGIVNGELHINHIDTICIHDNNVHIPGCHLSDSVIICELLVFELDCFDDITVNWMSEYLKRKWNI